MSYTDLDSQLDGQTAIAADNDLESLLPGHQFALLNPLDVAGEEWQSLPQQVLSPYHVDVRPHMLPRLILLDDLSSQLRRGLADTIERHRKRGISFFCALLKSGAGRDVVAEHLRYHLVHRRSVRREHWWLRFYDPLVFRHLCWQLNDDQLRRLFGPITQWCWQDGSGQWHVQRPPHSPHLLLPGLMLTEPQWRGIERMALLNRTLMTLGSTAPEREQNEAMWREVDALLQQAAQHRLINDEDRELFAEQAIRFHPRIHSHPVVARCLVQAIDDRLGYIEACSALDDGRMQQLADELAEGRAEHRHDARPYILDDRQITGRDAT